MYQQRLNPLPSDWPLSGVAATALAALPVVALFWSLVPRRWPAPRAAAAGAMTALVVAVAVYRMPVGMAGCAFLYGVAFGLLPVGWTIWSAMLLYNVTVETGHFHVVRRSVAGLSADARIQAILIGFAFGAFLEGAAGGGTPVAICGAIMVGLGFDPFLASVLCLIANTSPVAYGGLGTPLIVLGGVTGLPTETLSIMAGRQLPLLSLVVPLYMVRCMCSWKETWEVGPALLVAGGSFAAFQWTFATIHAHVPGLVVYPMTDIGGGVFSLLALAALLRFWKPRREWHYHPETRRPVSVGRAAPGCPPERTDPRAAAVPGDLAGGEAPDEAPLTAGRVAAAWAPYAIMSGLLLLTGLVRQREVTRPVYLGPVRTNYLLPVPMLDGAVARDPRLQEGPGGEGAREKAEFNLAWLTSPGSAVFLAAVLSMALLRTGAAGAARVVRKTFFQMRIPIPTIACMLGLSYVTRYGGLDATLGCAFAGAGLLYPFFAPLLGWLGVFLTGTDAGSNALFGSLQKITAAQIYSPSAFAPLGVEQLQVLICTSNSTGGVMGKMIDAQSICVATAATHQVGREADIFKAVLGHSVFLATLVGLITLAQAYLPPLTRLVPNPPPAVTGAPVP